ncbi:dienelactone hydrolase family protein [Paenibacillus sp. GSMTC-2017]|uniref:carboxylesterase family protein n=1 Tax=Paenibacillus sp. GSMTC-2017 TaxID=2794350 RepID=UPI002FBE71DC
MALLDQIESDYPVDLSHIYVTGFSLGGNGAWDLAAYHSVRFAAVAPLAGWFQPELAHLLKDIPVWAFHGADDDINPVTSTIDMVTALQEAGGHIKSTIYPPGLRHEIMQETYKGEELFNWFLQFNRQKARDNFS